MTATITLRNPNLFAVGALNIFCFTCSGSTVFDLSSYIPMGYKTINIQATFTDDDIDAANYITVNQDTETVTIDEDHSFNALVVCKRVGGA